ALVALMGTAADFVGPVNVGNPNEFTIRQLAEKVIELSGSSSTIEYKPLPADDPTQRRPDISLARRAFAWEPTTQLHEGLNKTIQYFDAMLTIDKIGA